MAFPPLSTRHGVFWLIMVLAALPLGSRALADGLPWSASYDAAQAQAKNSGKLMLVDVYTDWCVWCQKLDTDVYPKPPVVKAAALFIPVRINAEKEGKAVAAKYHVDAYPTILFLSSDGTLVSKITGYEEVDAFAADLTRIDEENRLLPTWEAAVKSDPTDRATSLKLALAYVHRERLADAQALATTLESGDKTTLGSLYNALGAAQSDQGQTAAAIASYQKTVAYSKVGEELVPAHIGLFQLYSQQNDLTQMKVQLRALAALPGTPAGLKARVKSLLDRLEGHLPHISTEDRSVPNPNYVPPGVNLRPAPKPSPVSSSRRAPVRFDFQYTFQPEPGTRLWHTADRHHWFETYPSGHVNRFLVKGNASLEGNPGLLLTDLPERKREFFVPDQGSRLMWLRMRPVGGDWLFVAEMHNIKFAP